MNTKIYQLLTQLANHEISVDEALLSMLTSCSCGVSVVNIDNGFGAGYQASMINHITAKK